MWECGAPNLPPSEEVTRRTEQVTRRIQELWMAMQDPSQREAFVPCAERIRVAVAELTAIFPQVEFLIFEHFSFASKGNFYSISIVFVESN